MANYKNTSHVAHVSTRVETPLYEDKNQIQPASSSSANTFGGWVQFSADIGTSKAIYGLITQCTDDLLGGEGQVIEISEGASSSEVTILRFNFPNKKGTITDQQHASIYKILTDNARISIRVKDTEASAKTHTTTLDIGPK